VNYSDIKREKLTFRYVGKTHFVANYQDHEVGIRVGNYPDQYLYNIFIDREFVHRSDQLPVNWEIILPDSAR
jgi:hypothetical protein